MAGQPVLKVSRALFTLIIAAVNAVMVFLGVILPMYLPANLTTPTVILVDALGNALIIYFTTIEPPAPSG